VSIPEPDMQKLRPGLLKRLFEAVCYSP